MVLEQARYEVLEARHGMAALELMESEMPDVVATLIEVYVERRHEDERFADTVSRLGIEPFKERVYAAAH